MRREVDPDDPPYPQAALIDEETNRRTEARLARYRARYEAQKRLQREERMAQQRREQMALVAAGVGTLAAIALGWIWYRKYVQKGRRRRLDGGAGGGGLPRDLFLEEESEEELQQVFDEAANVARKFHDGMMDKRDKLMLYGLYKQATEGDRNVDAVSACLMSLNHLTNCWTLR